MDSSTVAVVLNPVAGGGKGLGLVPRMTAALQSLNRPYYLHVTSAPNEAADVAQRFARDGAAVVIAVGGDGTINGVANGLLTSGRPVPLGIVPAGHGSDFVRTVKTPQVLEDALARACEGRCRAVDVGRATFADGSSRAFVNVAGLGFDAVVAERTQRTKLPGSNLPYLVALASSLVRYKNILVEVEADGRSITSKAVFVTVANAKFFGGGFMITPMAEIDDGWLDLAIVGDFSKFELLRTIPGVYKGSHVNHPKFIHLRATSVTVSCAEPARVQLDGELAGSAPVTFAVEPGALLLAG